MLPRLTGPFDFVFIDCVKTEYEDYLDALLPKLERGAVIVCDNLLWKGRVAAGEHDAPTDALRAFNRAPVTNDPRLITSILPRGRWHGRFGASIVKRKKTAGRSPPFSCSIEWSVTSRPRPVGGGLRGLDHALDRDRDRRLDGVVGVDQ